MHDMPTCALGFKKYLFSCFGVEYLTYLKVASRISGKVNQMFFYLNFKSRKHISIKKS